MDKVIRFENCIECPYSREHPLIEDRLICPIVFAPYYALVKMEEEKHQDCKFEKGAMIISCIMCPHLEKGIREDKRIYKCLELDREISNPSILYHKCQLEELSDEDE